MTDLIIIIAWGSRSSHPCRRRRGAVSLCRQRAGVGKRRNNPRRDVKRLVEQLERKVVVYNGAQAGRQGVPDRVLILVTIAVEAVVMVVVVVGVIPKVGVHQTVRKSFAENLGSGKYKKSPGSTTRDGQTTRQMIRPDKTNRCQGNIFNLGTKEKGEPILVNECVCVCVIHVWKRLQYYTIPDERSKATRSASTIPNFFRCTLYCHDSHPLPLVSSPRHSHPRPPG